jgi:hypothetical protein
MKENNASHFKSSFTAGASAAVHHSSLSSGELPEGRVLPVAPSTPEWPECPNCPVAPEYPGLCLLCP